jgi:serine protease Do
MSVQELTPELRKQLNLPKGVGGVAVSAVKPDGLAAEAGLVPGVVIEEVNKKRVSDVAEFKKALGAEKDVVLLKVRHRGRAVFLALRLK